jgi:hypothetical protein
MDRSRPLKDDCRTLLISSVLHGNPTTGSCDAFGAVQSGKPASAGAVPSSPWHRTKAPSQCGLSDFCGCCPSGGAASSSTTRLRWRSGNGSCTRGVYNSCRRLPIAMSTKRKGWLRSRATMELTHEAGLVRSLFDPPHQSKCRRIMPVPTLQGTSLSLCGCLFFLIKTCGIAKKVTCKHCSAHHHGRIARALGTGRALRRCTKHASDGVDDGQRAREGRRRQG